MTKYAALPDKDGALLDIISVIPSVDFRCRHQVYAPVEMRTVAVFSDELDRVLDFLKLSKDECMPVETDHTDVTLYAVPYSRLDAVVAEAESKLEVTAYIKLCSSRDERNLRNAERNLRERYAALSGLQQSMVETIRTIKELEVQIRALKEGSKATAERLEQEFEKLNALPGVTRVDVVGAQLNVYTESVYIEYKGTEYYIGEFRIAYMPLEGSIAITNLTNPRGRRQHPHVSAPSEVCLGNMGAILQAVAAYHFDVATVLVMEFLKSYNDADAYLRIECWGNHDCDNECEGCEVHDRYRSEVDGVGDEEE